MLSSSTTTGRKARHSQLLIFPHIITHTHRGFFSLCQKRMYVKDFTQPFLPNFFFLRILVTWIKPHPPSEAFYILQVYGPFFYGFCVFTCCKRLPGELGDEENDENCVTNRERGWLTHNFHLLGGRVLPWRWGDAPLPPVSLMEKVLTFWNFGRDKKIR